MNGHRKSAKADLRRQILLPISGKPEIGVRRPSRLGAFCAERLRVTAIVPPGWHSYSSAI
jgi:hypothetical protein